MPRSVPRLGARALSSLVDGQLGGNLLSKYSMIGRFYATQAALDFLEHGIAAAARRQRPGLRAPGFSKRSWIILRAVVLHVPFADSDGQGGRMDDLIRHRRVGG